PRWRLHPSTGAQRAGTTARRGAGELRRAGGDGGMKKIEAIIRPDRLQSVQDALDELGASGLTVTEVVGCGAQRGYTEVYRGTRANISLQRKVKIEVVVPEDLAEGVGEPPARARRGALVDWSRVVSVPAGPFA